jgi:predicted mannosyl-3-phosphoglycerate phosphatase (HAD superfamily)
MSKKFSDDIELLKEKPYNETTIKRDKEYIAKKFEITLDELEKIINMPPKFYTDYPNNDKRLTRLYDLYRKLFPKKQ